MRTNKVVLIRHGESLWNKDNLFCGWYDAPLTEKGANDASKVAAAALREKCMRFDCVFTSVLQRAKHTVDIILKDLENTGIPVYYDWRLNERHYGNLTGFNKRQMADKYGDEKVQTWRRSYDVLPPAITSENPYYDIICNNPNFANIPSELFPYAESLKTTLLRLLPAWENEILPTVLSGKRVLVVTHGTVVRALIKHLENISDESISSLNIPNSIPCVYTFDMDTKQRVGKVSYLADENELNKLMEKTASLGK